MNDVTNIDYLSILSKKTFKISSCERKNVFFLTSSPFSVLKNNCLINNLL